MKRKHMTLAALGVAALVGVVVLWRVSQGGGPDEPGATAVDTRAGGRGGAGTPVEPAAASRSSAARTGSATERPELPLPGLGSADTPALEAMAQRAAGSADGDGGAGPRVYLRDDGAVVRDHRTRDAPPMTASTTPRPPSGVVKVEPTTVIAVRNAMRPIVHRCASAVPGTSLGAQPRLQGEVVISIAKENVSVDSAVIKVADVQEPAASQLHQCVSRGVGQMTLAIPGAADVSGHTLTLPFRLRQ